MSRLVGDCRKATITETTASCNRDAVEMWLREFLSFFWTCSTLRCKPDCDEPSVCKKKHQTSKHFESHKDILHERVERSMAAHCNVQDTECERTLVSTEQSHTKQDKPNKQTNKKATQHNEHSPAWFRCVTRQSLQRPPSSARRASESVQSRSTSKKFWKGKNRARQRVPPRLLLRTVSPMLYLFILDGNWQRAKGHFGGETFVCDSEW